MKVGTRHFHPVEQNDSRIRWERADAETSHKLVLALGKQRQGFMGMAVWFSLVFPVAILLVILGFYLKILIENLPIVDMPDVISYTFFALCIVFFSIFLFAQYLKNRPYLHPEKQREIWIFRAKCTDISTIWSGKSHRRYSAYFQKGGVHIRIPIQWSVHQANPTGKEYIFFKFNERTCNPWSAIAADELKEFQ